MLTQGEEPRGIFASGHTTSGVFEDLHWDGERAAQGQMTNYVRIRLDVLRNPHTESILPREWLNGPAFADMYWNTQSSGVTIPDDVAEALEEEWSRFIEKGG